MWVYGISNFRGVSIAFIVKSYDIILEWFVFFLECICESIGFLFFFGIVLVSIVLL